MEKLMKPAEYAKILGVSRQAIYAKVKRGMLEAKEVNGKLYIVLDEEAKEKLAQKRPEVPQESHQALLEAKDETIALLSEQIKVLKKLNKKMHKTMQSEIDLLKEAFLEMQQMYQGQLRHYQEELTLLPELSLVEERESTTHWIEVKQFFKEMGIVKKKEKRRYKEAFEEAYRLGDSRFKRKDGVLNVQKEALLKEGVVIDGNTQETFTRA
jgi:predicted DNA-binding protein YlxM (UPF0122 family)